MSEAGVPPIPPIPPPPPAPETFPGAIPPSQPYSPFVPPSGTLMQAVRGPLMMITLGILLAVDSMGGFTINHTWPIMLIAYGVLRLMERMDGTRSELNS